MRTIRNPWPTVSSPPTPETTDRACKGGSSGWLGSSVPQLPWAGHSAGDTGLCHSASGIIPILHVSKTPSPWLTRSKGRMGEECPALTLVPSAVQADCRHLVLLSTPSDRSSVPAGSYHGHVPSHLGSLGQSKGTRDGKRTKPPARGVVGIQCDDRGKKTGGDSQRAWTWAGGWLGSWASITQQRPGPLGTGAGPALLWPLHLMCLQHRGAPWAWASGLPSDWLLLHSSPRA